MNTYYITTYTTRVLNLFMMKQYLREFTILLLLCLFLRETTARYISW